MRLSRRAFFREMGTLLAASVLAGAVPAVLQVVRRNDRKAEARSEAKPVGYDWDAHRWAFVVDVNKCIGCGKCVLACKTENDVPMEPEFNRTWVERCITTEDGEQFIDSPNGGIDGFDAEHQNAKYQNLEIREACFVSKLCNQCQNPPCVQVCPVGATYRTKDGVVLVDRDRCIGCRYCIQACPYGARFLDPRYRVADKCTWCYHRITKGMAPACVEMCPVGARIFGDLRDEKSSVREILRREKVDVLKPSLGTEPSVFYIGLPLGVG